MSDNQDDNDKNGNLRFLKKHKSASSSQFFSDEADTSGLHSGK